METISDKQVGELWRGYAKVVSEQGDHVRLLICKLVEERRNYYQATWLGTVLENGAAERSLDQALHEFNITPAEWEHPNG